MTAEELQGIIMGFLEMEDTEPQEAVSAVGQSLLLLLLATCQMNNYSEDVIKSTLEFLDKIKKTLLDDINEHTPKGEEYWTMDEIKEQIESMSNKLDENEVDKRNRVNGCKQIMDTDTLGFLLLSYLKNGNVSLCSNLTDKKMTDKVLAVMRETLFNPNSKVKKI